MRTVLHPRPGRLCTSDGSGWVLTEVDHIGPAIRLRIDVRHEGATRSRSVCVPYAAYMKALTAALTGLVLMIVSPCVFADDEANVRMTIQLFYRSFDEGFTGPINYAAEDWNHINPNGGRARGRDAVLKEVCSVHQSFLKGATDRVENIDVRFASASVAIGTVISIMSAFTMPDGAKHAPERHIRTFVLVKRGSRWMIMQDQNTTILDATH